MIICILLLLSLMLSRSSILAEQLDFLLYSSSESVKTYNLYANLTDFRDEPRFGAFVEAFCEVELKLGHRECGLAKESLSDAVEREDFVRGTASSEDTVVNIRSKDTGVTASVPVGKWTYGFPIIHWWDLTKAGSSSLEEGVSLVSIGRYCSLADNIQIILDGNHCYKRISSYPFESRRGKKIFSINSERNIGYSDFVAREKVESKNSHPCKEMHVKKVEIGNDVWIGADVLIMGGVTIGDGAVVGARAVVRTNVEPYSIVYGNPAVHIRYRFESAFVRSELLRIRWWEWDDATVDDNMEGLFLSDEELSSEAFLQKLQEIDCLFRGAQKNETCDIGFNA